MQQPQPPRQYSGHGISSTFSSSANPNEDWTKISDLAERRRIQNRIAQRNYRKKLKKRLEDLERQAGTLDDSSSPGTEKTSPVQKRELYDLDVDCEPEMDNETISGRCRHIRQRLTDLLTVVKKGSAQVPETVTSSKIKDALERFMLWAGNLGALRTPASKLSLDSRLASSQDLRNYISTELENLSEAIEDLMNIANGSRPNRDIGYGSGSESDLDMESDESSGSESDLDMKSDDSSYSDDPVDEAGSILQVISQSITSLLKISTLVRLPASSETDPFHRASGDSSANYWARRWRQITDVPGDNSGEEMREEDDSNRLGPSLQRGTLEMEGPDAQVLEKATILSQDVERVASAHGIYSSSTSHMLERPQSL